MTFHPQRTEIDAIQSRSNSTPRWAQRLANLVSAAFHSAETLAPIGCHFHQDLDDPSSQAEVTLFVSSTEFFGGAWDGRVKQSRFMLDLGQVLEQFSEIRSFYWQAQTIADDDQVGPHIGLEGSFEGHPVWLRIAANAPDQFEPGRVVDWNSNEFENRW